MRLNAGNVFPSAGSMNSLLAHPDGDDAVAVLLQGHAAVVRSVGTPLSTHGSALGVIAPGEGIDATRQTQSCEQQQYPHLALPQLCLRRLTQEHDLQFGQNVGLNLDDGRQFVGTRTHRSKKRPTRSPSRRAEGSMLASRCRALWRS